VDSLAEPNARSASILVAPGHPTRLTGGTRAPTARRRPRSLATGPAIGSPDQREGSRMRRRRNRGLTPGRRLLRWLRDLELSWLPHGFIVKGLDLAVEVRDQELGEAAEVQVERAI
jgi:hypothetical protein